MRMDFALFVENDAALLVISGDKVAKHPCSTTRPSGFDPNPVWRVKIRNAASAVESPVHGRVIVTDTIGRHFGLDLASGDICWTSPASGEGDPGLVLTHKRFLLGERHVFLFATWDGVLHRLDPEDGRPVGHPQKVAAMARCLRLATDGRVSIVALAPAAADTDPVEETLCRLDTTTGRRAPLMAAVFTNGIHLSPDGRRALCNFVLAGPFDDRAPSVQRWEIRSVADGAVLAVRDFSSAEFVHRAPVWSPDGSLVAAATERGHVFFRAEDLAVIAQAPAEYGAAPAFSHASDKVCLARPKDSRIVATGDLGRAFPAID